MKALIVTMPRSGTWFIKSVLAQLGMDTEEDGDYPVCHAADPSKVWNPSQAWGWELYQNALKENKPITFVYRDNKLSQLISMYRHMINHLDETLMERDGKRFTSFADFVERAGLEAYEAHMDKPNSFKGDGGNIYHIPYCDFLVKPDAQMAYIVRRCGRSFCKQQIEMAIMECTKENLAAKERENGCLANDQKEGSFHIKEKPSNPLFIPETGETICKEFLKENGLGLW